MLVRYCIGLMKHMRYLFLLFFASFLNGPANGQSEDPVHIVEKTVVTWNDTLQLQFLHDPSMYAGGWDTLAQSRFWREVINMTSDSCLINVAYCRKPITKVNRSIWMNQTEPEKICYKDSLSVVHCVDSSGMFYVTTGKREFYEVRKTLSSISEAIKIFEDQDCDPWYAQTILLIESPGKNKAKSSVGAGGPFQLMASVARKYGLRVTKTVDDRADLNKSAKAAARLIRSSCVPSIINMLEERNISYDQSDLWFRLLVLHAYHAGAGNVRCVINSLNPTEGGVALFQQIWQTTCASFKNESQNYSQIALGALLNFDALIQRDGDTVFLVQGDKHLRSFSRKNMKPWEAYDYLTMCMNEYESDFIDGVIPYDYFMVRVGKIRKEFSDLATIVSKSEKAVVLKKYPAEENHINEIASALTRRQRYEDAILMLKINLDMYPDSPAVYDSLARAYRLSGDKKMAEVYSNKFSDKTKNP